MASVIVLENGKDNLQAAQLKEELLAQNVTILGSLNPGKVARPDADSAIAMGLVELISSSRSKRTILLDSRIAGRVKELGQLLTMLDSNSAAICFAQIRSSQELTTIPSINANELQDSLVNQKHWPFLAVAFDNAFLSQLGNLSASSSSGFLLQAFVTAIANAENIGRDQEMRIDLDQSEIEIMCSTSESERSLALRTMINSINIEELFPNHSWELHSTESAAAGYHKLAAGFISLQDCDSALECLALSDQLEDSPRSLALKGLIALAQGQTLAAVANMVSSLQEYEKRKEDKEQRHYLSFMPGNLEVINARLQSGLDALNKRENDRALGFFTDAVFGFDPLFQDYGLDQLKNESH